MPPKQPVQAALLLVLCQQRADSCQNLPQIPLTECYNRDLGKADLDFHGCRWYEEDPQQRCRQACAKADDNFNASEVCCLCGGGQKEPNTLGQIVSLEAFNSIEWAFHTAAHLSFTFGIFIFTFALATAGVWILLWSAARAAETLGLRNLAKCFYSLLKLATPIASSYCGLLLLTYISSLPIFGRPKKDDGLRVAWCGDAAIWISPGFPHFGAVRWEDGSDGMDLSLSQLGVNIFYLFLNGVGLLLLPYTAMLVVMSVASFTIVLPTVLFLGGALLLVARISDLAAKTTLGGSEKPEALENPEASEKPEALDCGECCPQPCQVLWKVLRLMWSIVVRALSICLMFIVDFLVLFSIMANISFQFPSLRFPSYDIDLFIDLNLTMPQFLVDLFSWLVDLFSFIKLPDWNLRCASLNMCTSLLNLFMSCFAVSVVLSADLITLVLNRRSRMGNPLSPGSQRVEVVAMVVRAFKRGVVDASKFLTWKVVTFITNSVSLYVVVSMQRVWQPKGGEERGNSLVWHALENECTWGVHGLAILLSFYMAFCTTAYVFRVFTGLVYKDGAWILAAALVQEENLFTMSTCRRLMALLKTCLGAFLLPGAPLGLTERHLEDLKKEFYKEKAVHGQGGKEAAEKDEEEPPVLVEEQKLFFCPKCVALVTEKNKAEKKVHHNKLKKAIPDSFFARCVYEARCLVGMPPEQDCDVLEGELVELKQAEPEKLVLTRTALNKLAELTECSDEDKAAEEAKALVRRVLSPPRTEEEVAGGCSGRCKELARALLQRVVDLFSSKEVLALALLDLLMDNKLKDLGQETIRNEYAWKQSQPFDVSNLEDFRLSDFLDAAINAFQQQKAHVGCRLRQLLCMPWGIVHGKQLPAMHASERCIIWKSEVEHVAQASGMTYAITVFAVPIIGPFLATPFMYLNEVPAWVRIKYDASKAHMDGDMYKAGMYSYKQSPPENTEWSRKGSQGVAPSKYLKILWCLNFMKAVLLLIAVCFPRQILNTVIVLFAISLVSGPLVDKEAAIWLDRNKLINEIDAMKHQAKAEELRRRHVQRDEQNAERERAEKDQARAKWDKEEKESEEREREKHDKAWKQRARDDVEPELKVVGFVHFQRVRDKGADDLLRSAEALTDRVADQNGRLSEQMAIFRKKLQEATRTLGKELQAQADQYEQGFAVKTFGSTIVPPKTSHMLSEMRKASETPETHLFADALTQKVAQWSLFIWGLGTAEINIPALREQVTVMVPSYDVKKMGSGPDFDTSLDFDFAYTFNPRKFILSKEKADLLEREVELVRGIMAMAADSLQKVLECAREAQKARSSIPESGRKVAEKSAALTKQEADDRLKQKKAAENAADEKARRFWRRGKSRNSREEREGVKEQEREEKAQVNKTYTFMLPQGDLNNRNKHNEDEVKKVVEAVSVLYSNVRIILDAIKDGLVHGQRRVEEVLGLMSNQGFLGILRNHVACWSEGTPVSLEKTEELESSANAPHVVASYGPVGVP